ncbi:MAG: hypothetical protein ACJ8OJ_11170 [Povalibacter sp.]
MHSAYVRALFVLMISVATIGHASADAALGGKERKPHELTILTTTPLTAASQQALIVKLNQIRGALRATPALANLRGYDWETYASIKTGTDAASPVVGVVGYIAFAYFKNPKTGALEPSVEGPGLKIHLNDPEVLLPDGLYNVDQDARFALEPKQIGEIDGFPVYEGQFVVMSKRGQPLFVPISQETYLNRLIATARKDVADINKQFRSVPEDPRVQQGEIDSRLAAIKQSRADNEQRWAQMSRWPDRVVAERAKYDAKERQWIAEVDDLRTSTPRQRFTRKFDQRLASLEQELAALTAEQKASNAYQPRNPNGSRASGLAQLGSEDGTRIVTLNPQLFDKNKGRAAIQLLVIGTTRYFPAVYDEVQHQLDKTTLLGLID